MGPPLMPCRHGAAMPCHHLHRHGLQIQEVACTAVAPPAAAPALLSHLHAYPPAQRQALAAAHVAHHAALAALHLAARPNLNARRLCCPGVVVCWYPRLGSLPCLWTLRQGERAGPCGWYS